MATPEIPGTTRSVFDYYRGYETFMRKYHNDLFIKFYTNIHPPRKIGDCVRIMQGARHSNEDYAEISRISREFCATYPGPDDFPATF
ncbi:MAG TPA: hypothetical protein VKR53_19290 [Puia sp.]|nr:hypothetical protein [Puia sp.]